MITLGKTRLRKCVRECSARNIPGAKRETFPIFTKCSARNICRDRLPLKMFRAEHFGNDADLTHFHKMFRAEHSPSHFRRDTPEPAARAGVVIHVGKDDCHSMSPRAM